MSADQWQKQRRLDCLVTVMTVVVCAAVVVPFSNPTFRWMTLLGAGRLLQDSNSYLLAKWAYQEAVDTSRSFGAKDIRVPETMKYLYDDLIEARDYKQAIEVGQEKLRLHEQILGQAHYAVASDLDDIASAFSYDGKEKEAELTYNRALQAYIKVLGPEHPTVAYELNSIGCALKDRDPDTAEGFLKRAAELKDKSAAANKDPSIVDAYLFDLGECCTETGNFAEAEASLKKALAIRKELLKIEDSRAKEDRDGDWKNAVHRVAACYSALGKLYGKRRDYAASAKMYEEAFQLEDSAWGADDEDSRQAAVQAAQAYRMVRQFDKAIALADKLVDDYGSREKILIYQDKGDLDKAAKIAEEAAQDAEELTEDWADALELQAKILSRQKKYGDAEKCWKKIVSGDFETVGWSGRAKKMPERYESFATTLALEGKNQEAGRAMEKLRKLLEEQGETVEAIIDGEVVAHLYYRTRQYQKAFERYQKVYRSISSKQRDEPSVALERAGGLTAMSACQSLLDRRAKAIEFADQGVALADKTAKNNKLTRSQRQSHVYVLRMGSMIHAAWDEYDQSIALMQRAIVMANTCLYPVEVADCEADLGRILTSRGAYSAAEKLLLKAYYTFKSAPDQERNVMITATGLAENYHEQGKFKEAERFAEEAYNLHVNLNNAFDSNARGAVHIYACLLRELGKLDRSEQLLRDQLKLRETQAAGAITDDSDAMPDVIALAETLSAKKSFLEAEQLLNAVLQRVQRTDLHNGYLEGWVLNVMAKVKAQQKQAAEAARLNNQGDAIMRKIVVPGHYLLKQPV